MLELVKQLNNAKFDELYRLEVAGQQVGYVRPALAEKLVERAPEFFGQTGPQTITVIAENLTPQELTERFKTLHEQLAAEGILPKPVKEFSDVRANIGDEPLFQVNRSLIFPLGIISRGVHAILTFENGDFLVAKRSDKVFTFQGCFDISVGGLLPSGKDPWDHVKVEAAEEGSFDLSAIRPSGEAKVLRYARNVQGKQDGDKYKPAFPFETDGGTNWDEVYCWPITIPDSTVPVPNDGEVKSFQRMTAIEMIDSLRNEPDRWKTNSGVMLLQYVANDPRYSALFSAEERKELDSLLVPDPRPLHSRGELPPATANKQAGNHTPKP